MPTEYAYTILETRRMSIRTFVPSDLEELKKLHVDNEVMKYLVGGVRASEIEIARDLAHYIEHQEEHGFSKWAVIERATGQFMGRAGLMLLPNSDEIDLGYAFYSRYWNQGYGSEVAEAIFRWGREKLSPGSRLVGIVHPDNQWSARVLHKIGFRLIDADATYSDMRVHLFRPDASKN